MLEYQGNLPKPIDKQFDYVLDNIVEEGSRLKLSAIYPDVTKGSSLKRSQWQLLTYSAHLRLGTELT